MTVQFDYSKIRNTAIGIVKKFGAHVPCILLRPAEAAPPISSLPWRLGPATRINAFPFTGVISTLGFPRRSDPITDRELDIIAPGDLAQVFSTLDPTMQCGSPNTTDRVQVTDQGNVTQYAIIGVQDITPDALTIIFKLRCKAFPDITAQAPAGF